MDVLAICIVTIVILFLSVFITKRKFGLLGFALATGSILSTIWVDKSAWVLGMLNAPSDSLVVAGVSAAFILAPALLLIFHDGKYKSFLGRVIGAGLFTLLAMAFLVEPIGRVVISQGVFAVIYDWVVGNKNTILVVCLSLAMVDILMPKHNHSHERHQSH